MKKVNFLFGIHNHQPVGNFEGVFKDCFQKSYLPFIEILERHPGIRISLHYSGPLLEWIEKNEPVFLDRIKALVEKGQVEMLGGGFYEPIFSILPERDVMGQIEMLTEYTEKKFGYRPKGVWLAERVWDPSLPKVMAQKGIKYTILDDTHFFYAGLEEKEVFGYYVTEKEGYTVSVFPINKFLRDAIPFKIPEETIRYFKELLQERDEVGITFADDGEKFGVWPGTHQWVYKEKWLENFFSLLEENSSWINMVTFSEYLERYPSKGRIYLPTASYEEMAEWALPVQAAIKMEDMLENLNRLELREKYRTYIRGGIWNNFLVKYPESNLMHKKMLSVSDKVNKITDTRIQALARRELYRGQSNCAYWHGLFGGIYLNYLRHGVYYHLLKAEKICSDAVHKNDKWLTVEKIDYDKDNQEEILVSNAKMNAYFDPDYGGSLFELDYLPKSFCLSNTLARREESYHRKLIAGNGTKASSNHEGQPLSIHNIVKTKEEGLEKHLFRDWYERRSFLDHFFGPETSLENVSKCQYAELGDFVNQPYVVEKINQGKGKKTTIVLKREGRIFHNQTHQRVNVEKAFTFCPDDSSIEVEYCIENCTEGKASLWFGVEFNLTLLAGEDEKRYYHYPCNGLGDRRMISQGTLKEVETFGMVDEWSGFKLTFSFDQPPDLWRFPIKTVSQSEDGFESTYQGSVILPNWKLDLKKRCTLKFKLQIEDI